MEAKAGKKARPNGVPAAPSVEPGPVLVALRKRIRNVNKRLRGIEEIQEKKDSGKTLNQEQVRIGLGSAAGGGDAVEAGRWRGRAGIHMQCARHPRPQELALSSKPALTAVVEELEKMTKVLEDAVKEEVTAAVATAREAAVAEAAAGEKAALSRPSKSAWAVTSAAAAVAIAGTCAVPRPRLALLGCSRAAPTRAAPSEAG